MSRPSPGSAQGAQAAGIAGWLRGAVPSARDAVLGSVAWALAIGAIAATKLAWSGWYDPERIYFITFFFVLGGFLAFVPAICLGRFLSRGRRDAGFAATFLALAVGTIGATAFLFGLQYRLYYAAWHETPFSVGWIFQFVFTMGAAVYQFLALGVRAYLPLGLVALAAFSFWNVRRMR